VRFSETLACAASLLRLRRINVVLSQTQLPEGSAYRLLTNLLTSSPSFVLSFPVESTYLWVPVIWNGRHCWGTMVLQSPEFRMKLRELLGQRHFADSWPRREGADECLRSDQEHPAIFGVRFSRCHQLLYFIACRVLESPDRAEDAVENCRLTASRNPPKFECEGAFRGWLLRVLIDEALAIRRHSQETNGPFAPQPNAGPWSLVQIKPVNLKPLE
jgi:Sigma-70 region 2